MKTLFCSVGLILLLTGMGRAQTPLQAKIEGSLLDENAKPMEFVTLMLLKAQDSSLVKGAISDASGKYAFDKVAEGNYLVTASMLGYEKMYTNVLVVDQAHLRVHLGSITLRTAAQKLKEVVVAAKKPFIEQRIDKTVVNVENSIVSSGGTAMEVLEKSPGITIDKDDKISLKGKQGVVVMIDGKPTYLSASEVSAMLRNMQSNSIEQIEIINNPSAKYDAAGNAGIINIKLKKDKNMGANGSVSLGAGYGRFPKYNSGLNLNYRNKQVNFFGNYSYGYNKRYGSTSLLRKVVNNGEETIFDQYNYRPNESKNHSFKAGLDFYINKKTTIGFLVNGYINDGLLNITNHTRITGNDQQLDSSIVLLNSATNHWQNMTYNANYRHTFDSTGRELSVDLDYSSVDGQSNDNISNTYYTSTGEENRQPLILKSNLPSNIDIRSFKSDYVHPLAKGAKVEAGIKSSFVTTDNDVRFNVLNNEQWVVDRDKTNHFKYKERINAAYVNYSKEVKNLGIQLGLRAEQTVSKGHSITLNKVVDLNYLEWFPSAFITQKLNKDHQMGYSYSRRIDRPSYEDLNPFVKFLDSYTYFQGNPFLKPQFTNAFQVSHTYRGEFITTIGYSHTKNGFNQVTEQNDSTKVTRATMANLNSLDNYSLGFSVPLHITKWWTANNNANIFYNQYKSDYLGGNLNNAQLSVELNSNHSFTLPKNFSAEVSGFYNSPFADGILRAKSMYSVSFGVQKSFLNKKANLKLNVNDAFNLMQFRGKIDYQNMNLAIRGRWESRQVRLTFSYRFGKNEVKPARRRTTGSESEQNRIKMGGS